MKRTTILTGSALAVAASFLAFQSADAQNIFWNNSSNQIWTTDYSGGTPTQIFDGSGLDGDIVGLAATSTHLYWTDKNDTATGGGIWRSDHNGGGAIQLVQNDGSFLSPQFLAVDPASNRIYFTDWTLGIFSANLTTGGDINNIGNPGLTTDATGRNTGIALVGPNQLISVAANSGDRNIYSTDIADGSHVTIGQYASTHHASYGLAFHGDGNTAFNTTLNNADLSATDLGTLDSDVVGTGIGTALGVAINPEQTHLYIVGRTDGNIYSYNLATEQLDLFLTGTGAHFGIAAIPEPGTYALLFGLGVGAMVLIRRRMKTA